MGLVISFGFLWEINVDIIIFEKNVFPDPRLPKSKIVSLPESFFAKSLANSNISFSDLINIEFSKLFMSISRTETRGKRSVKDLSIKIKKDQTDVKNVVSKKRINIKNKNLKASSKDWLKRHLNDRFVSKAKDENFISRAVYKLIEINAKYKIFKNANNIIDLGCSPGSWSQFIVRNTNNKKFKLCMTDLLPLGSNIDITENENIKYIKGDFTESETQDNIEKFFSSNVDLILSDIAPNMSGIRDLDMLQMEQIIDSIYGFSKKILSEKGNLIFKAFHGSINQELMKEFRNSFEKVNIFKPEASRKESSEVYVVCINKKIDI